MKTRGKGRYVDLDDLRLVGLHELRSLLGGLSRQRTYQISNREHFPRPIAELGAGKIWLAEDVEEFIARYRPDQRVVADEAP